MTSNGRPPGALDALGRYGTCVLANAIERLRVRPRNEGFTSGGPVCWFPQNPPIVGHAVTGRIRTYMPPITGKCYYENLEWWKYVLTIPPPRVVVLEDFDNRPGFGAIFGAIHARICRALDCVAYVTNGAVRDLNEVEPLGFQLFAGSVAVSHAYAHVVDFGEPVEIGGLPIQPGDVLHGDRHGILSIPREVVDHLAPAAEQILGEEKDLIALTASPDFSVDKLGAKLQQFAESHRCT